MVVVIGFGEILLYILLIFWFNFVLIIDIVFLLLKVGNLFCSFVSFFKKFLWIKLGFVDSVWFILMNVGFKWVSIFCSWVVCLGVFLILWYCYLFYKIFKIKLVKEKIIIRNF